MISIDPNEIIIFSKSYCPFCNKAKELLNGYNVKYFVNELDKQKNGETIQRELQSMTKQHTVPNIFIYGIHIGGYSSLKKLHIDNQLQYILKKQIQYNCDQCTLPYYSHKNCNCEKKFDNWINPI